MESSPQALLLELLISNTKGLHFFTFLSPEIYGTDNPRHICTRRKKIPCRIYFFWVLFQLFLQPLQIPILKCPESSIDTPATPFPQALSEWHMGVYHCLIMCSSFPQHCRWGWALSPHLHSLRFLSILRTVAEEKNHAAHRSRSLSVDRS